MGPAKEGNLPLPEYRNPNQAGGANNSGGGGSSNFLVTIILALGVVFGLQWWQSKHNPQTAAPAKTTATQPAANQPASSPAQTPAAPAVTSPSATPAIAAAAEQTTVVENKVYKITFSNRGGEVRSWILKKYRDNEGKPLDLVHDGASQLYGYPLSLYTYNADMTKTLNTALYVPSATGTLTAPASLTFKWSAGDLSVTKTFTFGDDYTIHADTLVLQNGQPVRALLAWPAGLGDTEDARAYEAAEIDTNSNGKVEHVSPKKVIGGATLNGPFDYIGPTDGYFGAVFLPDHPSDATAATLHHEIDINKVARRTGLGQGTPASNAKPVEVPVLGAAVGDLSGHNQERLFVGPKAINVLKNVKTASGSNIESLLDFGFFGSIGKWLFVGLRAVHSWIAPAVSGPHDYSWGWAVILFTALIYIVLMPLRYQSMKSAIKMQRIQPQVDAIKAKHGNPGPTDAKAANMNAEIMALQKSQGVSMLGGCIPSLVQLPLLWAFFTMMTRVVELRQAHWFWLHDLSAPDPYMILPAIMVVTQFLVQYYTPSPGVDPQQQKMMAFMMPLFSGWICLKYASGLALYWAFGNFIMIAQQAIMNRTALGREMRQLQLERAAAKAKAKGKTAGRILQGKR